MVWPKAVAAPKKRRRKERELLALIRAHVVMRRNDFAKAVKVYACVNFEPGSDLWHRLKHLGATERTPRRDDQSSPLSVVKQLEADAHAFLSNYY
jgi:hypothetical protein